MSIAFLGDSITFGWGLDDKSKKYSTLVCQRLNMEEENYGITGTLLAKAGLNNEDEKDFVSRSYLIDNADIAVIFGGTNDYFWSDKVIEGNDDSYFAHALNTIINRIKEKRVGKITLFVTPYPHNGIGNYEGGEYWKASNRHDTDSKNFNGHVLKDYSDAIVKACEENGIEYLNLHKDFEFDWRKHTMDGCHPNEEGHILLANAVAKKIKSLIK